MAEEVRGLRRDAQVERDQKREVPDSGVRVRCETKRGCIPAAYVPLGSGSRYSEKLFGLSSRCRGQQPSISCQITSIGTG